MYAKFAKKKLKIRVGIINGVTEKAGRVHFNDKSLDDIRRLEQELQPYLKNAPRVRYTHATSSLPPHLLPHLLPRCKQEAGE